MFYKPSYCCNCGDKIERAEWRLWDSRRFCQLCETEYKAGDIAQRATVVIGLILGLFGFTALIWPEKNAIEHKINDAAVVPRSLKGEPVRHSGTQPVAETTSKQVLSAEPEPTNTNSNFDKQISPPAKEQTKDSITSSDQGIYYCGAPTKKGTPCSRRVKTKGRCWQHEGIP